jgi:hypothetical protein
MRTDSMLLLGGLLMLIGTVAPTPADLLGHDNPATLLYWVGVAIIARALWLALGQHRPPRPPRLDTRA